MINPIHWQAGLDDLAKVGLNIFASCSVASLPGEISQHLPADRYLCLIGHGGRSYWDNRPSTLSLAKDPLDNYAIAQARKFAQNVLYDENPHILYPLANVSLPLQQLGRFFNLARPSLLGLDLNLTYGPWFAYRCVFLTSTLVPETRAQPFAPPCDSCVTKPCRPVCPASAVSPEGFAMSRCADYRLLSLTKCAARCLARNACPYRQEHHYSEEQIYYHMGRPEHLQMLAAYGAKK